MEEHCIKRLREEVTKKMREEQAMLKMAFPESVTSSHALLTLTREEMVPYKHMPNLAELAMGLTHTVTATGQIQHHGQEKLVVKLEEGTIYQAGDYLEQQKEQL